MDSALADHTGSGFDSKLKQDVLFCQNVVVCQLLLKRTILSLPKMTMLSTVSAGMLSEMAVQSNPSPKTFVTFRTGEH